ncbi:MAG: class I SAM-dependent methyltransferase [Bacteroidetes bacterium]|nr:class I SAM-dependent methyltransferase [Bacteroidota bacterium]
MVGGENSFNPKNWKDWILQHEQESVADIALRYGPKKDFPLADLLHQLKGRQIAKQKLPSWYVNFEVVYPDGLILEQCSSEATSSFKAQFATDKTVLDLTGGLGIDSLAFSNVAKKVIYAEQNERRCAAAKINFQAFQKNNIEVICGDAETLVDEGIAKDIDLIFIDPSRRSDSGKKIFRIEELQPNVIELKEKLLRKGAHVIIKLAPMLDISEGIRQLPETFRIDVLSWKGECRELLFHIKKGGTLPQIHCHDLDGNVPSLTFDYYKASQLSLSFSEPKKYIYEPNASVRKAGAWKSICDQYPVSILHANTHLFTSNEKINFPGRCFELLEVMPYKKEIILEKLAGRNAQMVFYNFPEEPVKVKKKIIVKSGEPLYLFFVGLHNVATRVLLCSLAD